jgi:hypothetical protein
MATYSGDSNNNGASSQCEPLTVNKASTSISTSLSSSSISAGGFAWDTATLSGETSTAGGTVTYYWSTSDTCPTGSANEVNTVTVSDGVVPESNPVTFNSAGTYYWYATYSGDANNNGATSPCEQLTVNKAPVSVSTLLSQSSINVGGSVYDTATLSGYTTTAGGTVTYYFSTSDTCPASSHTTWTTVTVSDGIVPNSSPYTFNSAGTYYWYATYSGDANNAGATSPCERLTVASLPTYYLTMSESGGGTVSPSSGYYSGQVVITATGTCKEGLSKGTKFTKWTGSGSGSYTGTNNPATVTMNGNIQETATFTLGACPQISSDSSGSALPYTSLVALLALVYLEEPRQKSFNLTHGGAGRRVGRLLTDARAL